MMARRMLHRGAQPLSLQSLVRIVATPANPSQCDVVRNASTSLPVTKFPRWQQSCQPALRRRNPLQMWKASAGLATDAAPTVNPEDVLRYWFKDADLASYKFPMQFWFFGGEAADNEIKEKFGECLERASRGEYDHWKSTPRGRVALVLVLDQFSRNCHRDSSQGFAQDEAALQITLDSIHQGIDQQLSNPLERYFLYMPLMHSESLQVHEEANRVFQKLVDDHKDVPELHDLFLGVFKFENSPFTMEATATVLEKTSTELEFQFEAAVVVTEISTAEVIDGVAPKEEAGAEVITDSAPLDCSREMKVSTDNGSTNDVFLTIEDCMTEMKDPSGNGASIVSSTIKDCIEELKDNAVEVKAIEVSSTIGNCMEELKDCTGNGTEVKATEVLLVDDSTGNGAGAVKATEVSSTIEVCMEELKDPSGNGASVVSSTIKDCMEELKNNAAEFKATEVSSMIENCMEELKDCTGNGTRVLTEVDKATEVLLVDDSTGNGAGVVKATEVSSTIEDCMEESKDTAGNGAAGVVKATEVSSTIEDCMEDVLKDSGTDNGAAGVVKATGVVSATIEDCKDSGAEIFKANDVHSTMVVFNEDGINLVVELKIEKSDEIATEPSWGDVPDANEEPPVVAAAATPRFVKRPRPPPENVDVDDIVQTMRNILMDLRNADDARLKPEDEEKVRSVLAHHPEANEKMGSGIDHIKIKRHSAFKESRCFWVVRTDGSEIDFSYHKCLKQMVAKEHPDFVDRYDAIYRAPKRARQA